MKDILWEEKNLIEQKKNSPNSQTTVPNVIINETKNVSVKNVCNVTGNKKIWKRNCPKCQCNIFHVEKWTRDKFIKDGRLCKNCSKSENVEGKTIGYLTAIKKVGSKGKCRAAVWLFRCVCGKEVVKTLSLVKKGRGDNCGCKHSEKIIKARGIQPYKWLFTKFQRECKKRKISTNISFEQFLQFTRIASCHYCRSNINWSKHHPDCRKHLESYGYHLDRKNNNESYSVENCVVCCNRCNFSKSDRFSYDEWYGMTDYFRKHSAA